MNSWSFAFRNLFRNSRRSLATGLAILVGFVGLVLLGGFIFRVEKTLQTQVVYLKYRGHIAIFRKEGLEKFASQPTRFQLLPEDVAKIRGILEAREDAIDWVGSSIESVGLLSNGEKSTPYQFLAVDPVSLDRGLHHPSVQRWARDFIGPEDEDFVLALRTDPTAISISTRLGELLNLFPPYSRLTEDQRSLQLAGLNYYGDLNAVNGELVSSHATGSEFSEATSLLGTLALSQDLLQTEGVQNMIVFLKDSSDVKIVLQELNRAFRSGDLPYEAYPFDHDDISPTYVGSMGFLYVMSGFFVFLICGAVILSVLNSLTMGILERTREIGTLRALGFRRSQISWMLTQESLCLTTLASVAGAVLAFVIAAVVNQMNIRFSPPGAPKSIQFVLSPEWNLFAVSYVLFVLLAGFGSYLLSYWKMKMKVVELLSDTGA